MYQRLTRFCDWLCLCSMTIMLTKDQSLLHTLCNFKSTATSSIHNIKHYRQNIKCCKTLKRQYILRPTSNNAVRKQMSIRAIAKRKRMLLKPCLNFDVTFFFPSLKAYFSSIFCRLLSTVLLVVLLVFLRWNKSF